MVNACSAPLAGEPLSETAAAGLAQLFKALGDPVRLRLVSLIGAHQGGEVRVCDLTAAFDLTQPAISHHLRVQREAGITNSERGGTWVYWPVPRAPERMSAPLSPPARNVPPPGGGPGRPAGAARQRWRLGRRAPAGDSRHGRAPSRALRDRMLAPEQPGTRTVAGC